MRARVGVRAFPYTEEARAGGWEREANERGEVVPAIPHLLVSRLTNGVPRVLADLGVKIWAGTEMVERVRVCFCACVKLDFPLTLPFCAHVESEFGAY